jgi:hypothetical protein
MTRDDVAPLTYSSSTSTHASKHAFTYGFQRTFLPSLLFAYCVADTVLDNQVKHTQ